MDKLIVKGLGQADGEYDLDVVDLINVGGPGALTTREQHTMKLATGVLPADLAAAVYGADASVMVCLTAIILARHGKKVNEQRLWDARFVYSDEVIDLDDGASVLLVLASRDEEDDASPPAELGPTLQPSRSGGESTPPMSEPQESAPSPTGLHVLPTSAASSQEILAS